MTYEPTTAVSTHYLLQPTPATLLPYSANPVSDLLENPWIRRHVDRGLGGFTLLDHIVGLAEHVAKATRGDTDPRVTQGLAYLRETHPQLFSSRGKQQ
ncbi:hypothetical protein HYV86_03660 [Candidatus Woesearchaeota archaeon]|nr:hypothetical protein [Candidatus Woesearchaeota archaeon]